MRGPRWLSDPDEAARHPWKTSVSSFVLVWLPATVYIYFRAAHHDLALSALAAVPLGLMVVVLGLAAIGQRRGWPAWVSGAPGSIPRSPIPASVLWAGVGLGIVLGGVTSGNLALVVAGLPLIALGLFWRLVKRSLPPR